MQIPRDYLQLAAAVVVAAAVVPLPLHRLRPVAARAEWATGTEDTAGDRQTVAAAEYTAAAAAAAVDYRRPAGQRRRHRHRGPIRVAVAGVHRPPVAAADVEGCQWLRSARPPAAAAVDREAEEDGAARPSRHRRRPAIDAAAVGEGRAAAVAAAAAMAVALAVSACGSRWARPTKSRFRPIW